MKFFALLFLTFLFVFTAHAQILERDFNLKVNGSVEIKNFYGRVYISAEEAQGEKVSVTAQSNISLAENEIKSAAANGKVTIEVNPKDEKIRVDLSVKIPLRARVQ